jgi:membrane associated rhomboid family serine protease
MILFALFALAGYAIYVMTPQERDRLLQAGLKVVHRAKDAAIEARERQDPFGDALRARTPLIVATPALAILNALVFTMMLFSAGAFGDPATLVAWGGNFGPRTTNGEWSRLVTAMFIHTGLFHLLITVVGMAQVGVLLERLLGPVAVTVVYLAAGTFASLEHLSSHPIGINVGAAGAVFGLYGLLIASVMWSILQRSRVPSATPDEPEVHGLGDLRRLMHMAVTEPAEPTEESASLEPADSRLVIPLSSLKPLAPAAGIFVLYTLISNGIGTPELSGLIAGFAFGLVFASNISVEKPGFVRVGAAMAATTLVVVTSAFLLRGLADVRPAIAHMVDVEDRTASTYQSAVEQFKLGALSAEALAKVIDQKITPELQTVRDEMKTLGRVPAEHKPLVDNAQEYLRLRDESWRMRAAALHKSNMKALRQADTAERASLEALERVRPSDHAEQK